MNRYLKNLDRLEFVITYSCTGRCKHCSQGDSELPKGFISPDTAISLIADISEHYKINSVMTFGGEPLLYPETVFAVHRIAKAVDIPERQIITNGFFSTDFVKISEMAENLADCGVNCILISVDAFHQESIPIEPVKKFASELKRCDIPTKINPAWVVKKEHNNPYNLRTHELLAEFMDMGFPVCSGNDIFPSGNALKYLGEYYDTSKAYINPYDENPKDIHSICFDPSGEILSGNFYEQNILEILENYTPNINK